MSAIDHNYLLQQFDNVEDIVEGVLAVVKRGDFTLGKEVEAFEHEFARMVGVKHAIGVGNGTDAIFLAVKQCGAGIGGGEVITTPYSFYATTASIVHAGAKPVFVDVGRDFNIDVRLIERAITPRTIGIVPVHWAGRPCDMNALMEIARTHGLWVMEDCAHAPNSIYQGRRCGAFGDLATFSLHPLKNVNVWGDGGVIVTDDDGRAQWLRKSRNHGMSDRNTCEFWGYNSRLDTIQAVVARHVLAGVEAITASRRRNASVLNWMLREVEGVELVPEAPGSFSNYYLYSLHAQRRDALQAFLMDHGVDAKVHYPTPLHLQPAARHLGYKKGDFPVAEWCAETTISLPVHEWITESQLMKMGSLIKQFYAT